jgi:GGDEF domain-containing protein
VRSTLSSFARRGTEPSWTPGRELSDAERGRLPAGFEAVAEALVSGRSPVAACAVVGRATAGDGASLAEALSGLAATYTALGGAVPEFAATEALSVAWSEATLEFLHELSCEDPLTGLASFSHLRTRVAELYREAERRGVPITTTHALVVVDVVGAPAEGAGAPFTRALRLAAVAEALRTLFGGEETIARAGSDRILVLVRRGVELGETLELARDLFSDLELPDLPRTWIEGLPAHPDPGVRLLSELAR